MPPPAAAKIPAARHAEVRGLRRRHTQAVVATMFGVSQVTIWRITRPAVGEERVASIEKIRS